MLALLISTALLIAPAAGGPAVCKWKDRHKPRCAEAVIYTHVPPKAAASAVTVTLTFGSDGEIQFDKGQPCDTNGECR